MQPVTRPIIAALCAGLLWLAPVEGSAQAVAQADTQGQLVMPGLQRMPEGNLGAATMRVFTEAGQLVEDTAGRAGVSADQPVTLDEGWYIISVGSLSAPGTLARVYVAAGHSTIVPTGWVEVTAIPLDGQPRVGCDPWDAQLSAFALAADGSERVVSMNDTGAGTYGAVQLLAFSHRVYFNGVPVGVDVQAYARTPIITGVQEAITGARPQLLAGSVDAPIAPPIALCEDGGTQVPAGSYSASAIVPVNTPPYERREWLEVNVAASRSHEVRPTPRTDVPGPIWRGEGASPTLLGDEHEAARSTILAPGGGARRLSGFGR
ncbi:MAG: hypothetical protein ACI81R_000952 [Bradymonadia bacterium]|jgi:hypothetical protein